MRRRTSTPLLDSVTTALPTQLLQSSSSPSCAAPFRRLGRYVIGGMLGSGGMAHVSLAKAAGADGFAKPVAIKQLRTENQANESLVAALLDEARLVSFIHHPNVVPIVDVVVAPTDLTSAPLGPPHIVMEYIFGEALSALVGASSSSSSSLGERERGLEGTSEQHNNNKTVRMPVPAAIAAAIAIDVLEGLHAAHEATDDKGIPLALVHRDVSPQNILVGADGVARITDFGIAKTTTGRFHQETTEHGIAKGKLMYMAPEQFGGRPVDRRTDVWAVGVVLWEMLAGRLLFPDGPALCRYHVAMEPVADPPVITPSSEPSLLHGVLQRALSHSPEARFETARDMAMAIETAIAPASASRVSQWVRHVAKERLKEKEECLRALDQIALAATHLSDPFHGEDHQQHHHDDDDVAQHRRDTARAADTARPAPLPRGNKPHPDDMAIVERTIAVERTVALALKPTSRSSIAPFELSSTSSSPQTEPAWKAATRRRMRKSLSSATIPLTATLVLALILSIGGWRVAAKEVARRNEAFAQTATASAASAGSSSLPPTPALNQTTVSPNLPDQAPSSSSEIRAAAPLISSAEPGRPVPATKTNKKRVTGKRTEPPVRTTSSPTTTTSSSSSSVTGHETPSPPTDPLKRDSRK